MGIVGSPLSSWTFDLKTIPKSKNYGSFQESNWGQGIPAATGRGPLYCRKPLFHRITSNTSWPHQTNFDAVVDASGG